MNDPLPLPARFAAAVRAFPLVAVLRGLRPDEAHAVGEALYAAGFRLVEVPLNSPEPMASVAVLRRTLPADALVGAGTVIDPADAERVRDAGGQMAFAPHFDPVVVGAAKAAGLVCVPGVATPTEAFGALRARADALKLFPAGDMITPPVVKAIRAVLPPEALLLPFGGITPERLRPYWDAGARAFGIGGALYKPGMGVDEIARRARGFAEAWAALSRPAVPVA